VGIGKGGEISCPSRVISGTPHRDPFAPVGSVLINGGSPFTDNREVILSFLTEPDVVSLVVANHSDLDGLKPIAFTPTLTWKLDPDATGYAAVYVRFIDKAGNASTIYSDDIRVLKRGAVVDVTGLALLEKEQDDSGVFIRLLGGPDTLPAFSDSTGKFLIPGVLPGTYEMELSRHGFKTVVLEKVVVKEGQVTDVGKVTLPRASTRPGFHRGDANGDGGEDLSDALFILVALFQGGPVPDCAEAADTNNDGKFDLSDGIFLLDFLFLGGKAPPAPGPSRLFPCGPDTDPEGSPGDLGCRDYHPCQ
jgi:hypothetical protein